jgi:hypothetical protein
VLRFFACVEMVEAAEVLVEAVVGRQKFVAVAQMVLSELAGRIAERLECLCNRNVPWLQA